MNRAVATFAIVAVLVTGFLVSMTVRSYRIRHCTDSGGTAVVPALFSDDPTDVRCILGPKARP